MTWLLLVSSRRCRLTSGFRCQGRSQLLLTCQTTAGAFCCCLPRNFVVVAGSCLETSLLCFEFWCWKSRTSTVRRPFSLFSVVVVDFPQSPFWPMVKDLFVTPCYIFKKETCRQFHVVRSTELYWFDSGIYMFDRTRLELHVVGSQSYIWLESGYNISPQWIAKLLSL